jgi:hypothetical protein
MPSPPGAAPAILVGLCLRASIPEHLISRVFRLFACSNTDRFRAESLFSVQDQCVVITWARRSTRQKHAPNTCQTRGKQAPNRSQTRANQVVFGMANRAPASIEGASLKAVPANPPQRRPGSQSRMKLVVGSQPQYRAYRRPCARLRVASGLVKPGPQGICSVSRSIQRNRRSSAHPSQPCARLRTSWATLRRLLQRFLILA